MNPIRVSPSERNPRKRSLSEMASSQSEGRPPPPVDGQETRDQELAWELLRVVVQLNEENQRQRKQEEEGTRNNINNYSCSNSNAMDHSSQNNNNVPPFNLGANGADIPLRFNPEVTTHENKQEAADDPQHPRLWSQQPLINCLAVLLVVQRLEQVQRELNEQTSQFMQMSQLLSDLLGQQFRLPIPPQTQSAIDWILPVCQRNPPALLGSLVACLLVTSQRQQKQQRMMESLQQQIVRLQENGGPVLSPQLFHMRAQQQQPPPPAQASLPDLLQQLFQQHQAPVPEEQDGQNNLSEALQRAVQQMFEQQQFQQDVPGQLQGHQQPQHQQPQHQQPQQSIHQEWQAQESEAGPLLRALLQLNDSRPNPGVEPAAPFVDAAFAPTKRYRSQDEQREIQVNYENGDGVNTEDTELDNADNDDISLAEDTDTDTDNANHSVPQYVNVPLQLPQRKAVVPAQDPVHVVPCLESARVVADDRTKAIMPPPRQDMEMVSSLSDAEESSASSTASSLTMGSVVSRLTA